MINPDGIVIGKSDDDFSKNPPLDEVDGSVFGYFDRLFFGWEDGKVFDYGDWAAQDLTEMLGKDYKAKQIETVLSHPILQAEFEFEAGKGDKGELAWVKDFWDSGFCRETLQDIVGHCTSAFTFKRAFFEKEWSRTPDGKIGYKSLGFRPQTTCRMMRDPKTGQFIGFRQEPLYLMGLGSNDQSNLNPIEIPKKRAFVYTHGKRLDPVNGTSDLDVAFWAWKTKTKLLFLWFQFLENTALPRIIVKGQDQGIVNAAARAIAAMKNSGVLPIATGGSVDSIMVSELTAARGVGGGQQFLDAINWLDEAATHSVLAGFLDLTKTGPGTSGSYALSSDASDFFLQTEEARAREIEEAINKDLIEPLVKYNFKNAVIPKFKFKPLNSEDQTPAITLLTAALALPNTAVPAAFIGDLAEKVAGYIGMDPEEVSAAFQKASDDAKKAAIAANPGLDENGKAVAGMAGIAGAAGQMAANGPAQPAADPNAPIGESADGKTLNVPANVAKVIGIHA